MKSSKERIHLRGQRLCKFMGTKEICYIRKGSNSHRICLEHQHGRCFIVLEHQYGRRDVMWKRSLSYTQMGQFIHLTEQNAGVLVDH